MSRELLWTPSKERIANSNVHRFMKDVEKNRGFDGSTFNDLWKWSVSDPKNFWDSIWDFGNIIGEKGERIANDAEKFWEYRYFPDAKLNFTENLIKRRDSGPALIFWGEEKVRKILTWKDLHDAVAKTASALKRAGIGKGDIVGGYVANMPETTIAALATISIGAIWASCSPDFGIPGALDRFGQIKPKVFFAVDGYYYKGKVFNNIEKIKNVVDQVTSIKQTIIIPYVKTGLPAGNRTDVALFHDFIGEGVVPELTFEKFPFDHPIYILFTSGTTGVPKCIVHGAGGTLLQHKKEQLLHCDIKPNDRVFYFTTCSWMMWNWSTSILAQDATLMQYEGLPLFPKSDVLFDMVDSCGMTFFGTSAKYLDTILKSDVCPTKTHKLDKLRTMGSTGSPLCAEACSFVYEKVKKDIHLNSFSGGTDIISSFVMGNPISPVYSGEMQGFGLGMHVKVYGPNNEEMPVGQQGELTCITPFASQPIKFWNDEGNKRLIRSYFEKFENCWCHGDWIELTEHGGVFISGRADAVLNPSGVRIGTAEIYSQVQKVEEVLECCAVGQQWDNDERVILFVVLRDGLELNDDLKKKISMIIRDNATPRHVPSKIIQVSGVPKTNNGKLVEIAVKNVIHGREVVNKDSIEDPSLLEEFRNIPELQKY
ncbi:MAG: acetoacetate--CoA ligase [Holosporaceae bacterium]|jgi:acetoacetyl-CoA synthetase|nr:acetoacetate--CoA ligase [Holosporaceae bacterium]